MSHRRGDPELASVMRKLLDSANHVGIDSHDWANPLFTLDDTTVPVTREEHRMLEEVLGR